MGFGKDHKGVIIREFHSNALGALANSTAIIVGNIVLEEDFRVLKKILTVNVANLTAGQGAGLVFGVSNAELTLLELQEAILVDGPTNRNDRLKEERAGRHVHIVGHARTDGVNATTLQFEGMNGANIIEDKFRWTYSDPEGWDYFVFNASTVLTSGAIVTTIATVYGVWVG